MEQQPPRALRTLVVDDEAPARKRLRDLLSEDVEIGTIVEAENGIDAIAAIENERPDIVFLDVQMPELDGFGVIGAVGADRMPLTRANFATVLCAAGCRLKGRDGPGAG